MAKREKKATRAAPELVEILDADKNRIRGYWIGEPKKSAFIQTGVVRDKRGLADGTKQHVRAWNAALDSLRKALDKPLPPAPRKVREGSVPAPAPEWGTLEYWRDRAQRAEDRVQLLESDVANLSRQLEEWRAPMTYLVDAPSKNGKSRKEPAWHADARTAAQELIQAGTSPRNVAGKLLRKPAFEGHSEDAIRRALRSKKPSQ